METKAIQLERVKVSDIKPYWRNPRDNEDAIDAVSDSISEFDYQNPIIVDSEYVIIAGHTRYRALLKDGFESCEVIISDLSDEKAKAYRIMDNKTAEKASWNWDKLIHELRALKPLKKFHVHFPELKIEPTNLNLNAVSDEKIEKTADALETKFEELSQRKQEAVESFQCPECGHEWEEM